MRSFALALLLAAAQPASTLRVAVAGAAGRTGRLLVKQLLESGETPVQVTALVRNAKAAEELLPSDANLRIQQCDLGAASPAKLQEVLADADAAIWCASGFSDASSPLNRLRGLFGVVLRPENYLEVRGLTRFGEAMASAPGLSPGAPQLVMCSAAAVTRPSWDEDKKAALAGCADIPIVRLNPFKILDIKAAGERALRQSGCRYAIVRPTGLNDKWPEARPIYSQGDVAVGRICRADVAYVLAEALRAPSACGKTFETTGLSGYPKTRDSDAAFARLRIDAHDPEANGAALSPDEVGTPNTHHKRIHCRVKTIEKKPLVGSSGARIAQTPSVVRARYELLQQLLPGEVQDAAALAMGQTYEQLDQGEEGRLGPRGQEQAPIAPTA